MDTKDTITWYAVARGRRQGIYPNKSLAMKETLGYPNALYTEVYTIEDAVQFLKENGVSDSTIAKLVPEQKQSVSPKKNTYYVYCGADCSDCVRVVAVIYNDKDEESNPLKVLEESLENVITDNERAELTAILMAIKAVPTGSTLYIYTDATSIITSSEAVREQLLQAKTKAKHKIHIRRKSTSTSKSRVDLANRLAKSLQRSDTASPATT